MTSQEAWDAYGRFRSWAASISAPGFTLVVNLPSGDWCETITVSIVMRVTCRDAWQRQEQMRRNVLEPSEMHDFLHTSGVEDYQKRTKELPTVLITSTRCIRLQTTREMFLQEMRHVMRAMTLHEFDEMFLVDGERVFDPHEAVVVVS